MIIYTSYWSQLKKVVANDLTPVSVSRGMPRYYKGEQFEGLFPTWPMIKNTLKLDDSAWEAKYLQDNLDTLDPAEIAKQLEGKVLLCWETPDKFCHRQCVARWLEQVTGVKVQELKFS